MKNINKNYAMNFIPGEKCVAIVRNVRMNGVSVEMPGAGSGIISTRCWGRGMERANALAAVHPGDEVEVTVRSWDPITKSLSLVLCGFEDLPPLPKKVTKTSAVNSWVDLANYRKPPKRPANTWTNVVKKPIPLGSDKPAFKPIPHEALLEIDLANVLGALETDEYLPTVRQLFDGFEKIGYKNVIGFIEKRTVCWYRHNASSTENVAAFDDFCRDMRVTVSGGESDLAMCQTGKVVANAYLISRDRMLDYADEFGEVVKNRLRSFGIVRLPGQLLINIDGISDAVVINKNLKSIAA